LRFNIKFKWKIAIFTIIIYILSLAVIGVVITENNYYSALRKEIRKSLNEGENISSTAALYIKINQKIENDKMSIERYSTRLVDMFKSQDIDIAIFNEELILKSSSALLATDSIREGLEEALKGNKSYILKWVDDRHYLVITDCITIDEEKLIMKYIYDISYIDVDRSNQYRFFIIVGVIGLILVTMVTGVISSIIIRPLEDLKKASREIASGNYQDRLKVRDSDEIGELGLQFNIMAEEIEKRIDELKEESQRKQKFIDNLAHELRTPLTSIIGYSDTLMNIKYDEKVFYKGLKFINIEGNRMIKMVNQLMDLILLRKDTFEMKEEELKPLLKEVEKVLAEKIRLRNVEVRIIGSNIKRNINRDLFKGMIINLLDNAVNASKDGDTITVGIQSNSDYDMVFVKDEGVGMDNEHIKNVIEPYYRADRSRSRKSGGAGLGLTLCNEIIRVHGGELEIESARGQGTKVKVKFYKSVTS